MARLRSTILVLTLAFTAPLWTACNTPTLPIPPPIVEEPLVVDPATGMVEVRVVNNIPDDASHLLVINQTTHSGVAEARLVDMTFLVRIPASAGDSLAVYFILHGTELSPSDTYEVH